MILDGSNPPSLSVAERLLQFLDHLGVSRAHFCLRAPQDILELARRAPERIASIVVLGAAGEPEEFSSFADRLLWVLGDEGGPAMAMAGRLAQHPEIRVHRLSGYAEFMWSDTVAERTDEVAGVVLDFLAETERSGAPTKMLTPHPDPLPKGEGDQTPLPLGEADGAQRSRVRVAPEGEVAGVTYRAAGSSTPVVLFPLGLSAHQWEPLLPRLQANHCTIVLGGKHLQPVENLEARAAGDYSRMALTHLDLAAPQPNESLIEIGCGSGALLRRIVRRTGMARVVGLDVNSFLLKEARALIAEEGLGDRVELREGSAEAIPFPDNSFDIAFSSTVMEEVDADRMLAEMARITRPGGRVAVIVRAVDRGQWTNLPLPKALKVKVEADTGSGGVSARGCADESLLRRFHDAGLRQVRGGPAWAWMQPGDAWWANSERQVLGNLSGDEIKTWRSALAAALAEGLPISVARPFHCAAGVKER